MEKSKCYFFSKEEEQFNIITSVQFDFHADRSASTMKTRLILLDFRTAFDILDYNIICRKLG